MEEYETLGHVKLVSNEDDLKSSYYIPHHAITKEDSLTTKVRVVFDASAPTSTGISLNNILMVGPTNQDSLFSIISRFRLHQYVLSADIEKMYRQILIDTIDTNYQRILWRKNSDENIKTIELQTVTYEIALAPFLATRTLYQLAEEESHNLPNTSQNLKSDVYVDDILTGANSLQDAITLRDELIKILHRGGLHPRKWISNDIRLLESLSDIADPLLNLDTSETTKTLGLYWNELNDCIQYKIDTEELQPILTKRIILSQIAKLFDPLGLIGPIITEAKCMMQTLWQLKSQWDEPVDEIIQAKWREFVEQLLFLNHLKIPRRIIICEVSEIQLHGFCDASLKAYGACIILRSTDTASNHMTQLVCAKSKVAPLKQICLPRLELCSVLLLSKLYKTTNNYNTLLD